MARCLFCSNFYGVGGLGSVTSLQWVRLLHCSGFGCFIGFEFDCFIAEGSGGLFYWVLGLHLHWED